MAKATNIIVIFQIVITKFLEIRLFLQITPYVSVLLPSYLDTSRDLEIFKTKFVGPFQNVLKRNIRICDSNITSFNLSFILAIKIN